MANTKERDFSIGLDNHGFRYFDPEAGRYVSRDPIGYADGMNVYVYVGNNPVNFVDPVGLNETTAEEEPDSPSPEKSIWSAIMEVAAREETDPIARTTLKVLDLAGSTFSRGASAANYLVNTGEGRKVLLEKAIDIRDTARHLPYGFGLPIDHRGRFISKERRKKQARGMIQGLLTVTNATVNQLARYANLPLKLAFAPTRSSSISAMEQELAASTLSHDQKALFLQYYTHYLDAMYENQVLQFNENNQWWESLYFRETAYGRQLTMDIGGPSGAFLSLVGFTHLIARADAALSARAAETGNSSSLLRASGGATGKSISRMAILRQKHATKWAAWQRYKASGRSMPIAKWARKYNTLQLNRIRGKAAEAFGAAGRTYNTPYGLRIVDNAPATEIKTGYAYRSRFIRMQVLKDSWLSRHVAGYRPFWSIRGRASQPLLDHLDTFGIPYEVTP